MRVYPFCYLLPERLFKSLLVLYIFELVFGHTPHGPIKLLKETWLSDDTPESLLTRMSNVCHRLRIANQLPQKHLKTTMKTWYD